MQNLLLFHQCGKKYAHLSCSLRLHCCLLALYSSVDGHSELSLCSRRSSVSPILQNLQQKSEKSVQTATMRRRHKTERGTSFTEQGTSLSLSLSLGTSVSVSVSLFSLRKSEDSFQGDPFLAVVCERRVAAPGKPGSSSSSCGVHREKLCAICSNCSSSPEISGATAGEKYASLSLSLSL